MKRTEINKLGEFGLIEHLTSLNKSKSSQQTQILKGIGDDAAVYKISDTHAHLLTSDALLEGIHFDLMYTPLKHLGYKAAVSNFSDCYAMNGHPKYMTVSLGLSNKVSVEALEELYSGLYHACHAYGVELVGGDTNASLQGIFIGITVVGEAEIHKITYRNNAKQGDILCVTGNLGAAYLGLQILEREKKLYLENPEIQPDLDHEEYLIKRQLKPEARKDVIEHLHALSLIPTSMIDVSDGLSSDLMHICKQSKIGAIIYESDVPIHIKAQHRAIKFNLDPITCALSGGEDYELLFTISPQDAEKISKMPDAKIIGKITYAEEGIKLQTLGGQLHKITAQGWNHMQ